MTELEYVLLLNNMRMLSGMSRAMPRSKAGSLSKHIDEYNGNGSMPSPCTIESACGMVEALYLFKTTLES